MRPDVKARRRMRQQDPAHQERVRKWRIEYKRRPEVKERDRLLNRSAHRKTYQAARQHKYRSTIMGRLRNRISRSMNYALRSGMNGKSWQEAVGYSIKDLKVHIEHQFVGDMSWEKFMLGEIHIDHIRPMSSFSFGDYSDLEFKQCWALENLQPLWAKDNLSKGAKIA